MTRQARLPSIGAPRDGTASAASGDYASASGQVIFNPDETEKLITVLVNGDMTEEAHETFFVNLSIANGAATLVDAQGVGTVLNDEATITMGDTAVIEGDSSIGLIDTFIPAETGGLGKPEDLPFGPDANGDGSQDLYVLNAIGSIDRFLWILRARIDSFVEVGSGGLALPSDFTFGVDGNSDGVDDLYATLPGSDTVLRFGRGHGASVALRRKQRCRLRAFGVAVVSRAHVALPSAATRTATESTISTWHRLRSTSCWFSAAQPVNSSTRLWQTEVAARIRRFMTWSLDLTGIMTELKTST